MFKQLTAGLNKKRWMWAMAAGAVYSFVSDFIIHGLILGEKYKQTANVWRPEAEMQQNFAFMLFGQILTGIMVATIFARGYQGKGWKEGIRFGVLLGLLLTGPMFINYAVMPIPSDIFMSWLVTGFIQCVLGGVVVAKVYAKK